MLGGDLLFGLRVALPPRPLDLTPQMVPVDLPHIPRVDLSDLAGGGHQGRQIPLIQQPAILVVRAEGKDDGLRIPGGDRDRDGQGLAVPLDPRRLPDQIDRGAPDRIAP